MIRRLDLHSCSKTYIDKRRIETEARAEECYWEDLSKSAEIFEAQRKKKKPRKKPEKPESET